MRLTLYGRSYCHLCEDMRLELERLRPQLGIAFTLELIDVDSNEALERRYGERVPVLVHEETEICHYFLDHAALAALLSRLQREAAQARIAGN